MHPRDLSVVVVSWGRADALRRCVLGLSQQYEAGLELVVVADPDGLAKLRDLPFADRIRMLPQPEPNISKARNLGIGACGGQIIGFVDDDAVPEPTWAQHICAAFDDPTCAAATGPVLGRNGISLQWGPIAVDHLGRDTPVDADAAIPPGQARKLQGTNMAIRRSVFERIGGFDEAMAFYLDDTDMAYRIGRAGLQAMWVPGAVVHHGFAASARRTEDRVPLSLEDIGASTAVYLRKHARVDEAERAIKRLEAAQASRLLALVKKRKLDARGMRDLMESLQRGLTIGADRPIAEMPVNSSDCVGCPLIGTNPPAPIVLSGKRRNAARLRRDAASKVAKGHGVTLFLFEPTPRKHRVLFTSGGWWEQIGGLYGPSIRAQKRLRISSFNVRLAEEIRRISAIRGL